MSENINGSGNPNEPTNENTNEVNENSQNQPSEINNEPINNQDQGINIEVNTDETQNIELNNENEKTEDQGINIEVNTDETQDIELSNENEQTEDQGINIEVETSETQNVEVSNQASQSGDASQGNEVSNSNSQASETGQNNEVSSNTSQSSNISQENEVTNGTSQTSETGQEKGSEQAQDYLLGLANQLSQRNINVDRLQVDVDKQTVFKMRDGEIEKSTITDEQAELIKKALKDPAALKGSVKITQGSQILLHVKNGKVLADKANLTQDSAKLEVKSQEQQYKEYSEGVESYGYRRSADIAKNALSDGMSSDHVKDMLKNQDPQFKDKFQSGNQKVEQMTNRSLDDTVKKAQAEINMEQNASQSQQQTKELVSARSRSR
ncbi:hypothetical protein cce_5015 [Crocosphaera subtropica ATCC 51142]|uniref:Uncharacterized protein n=1 Tax=Crocosphaera subtropica (strain ATCC 51142 / BH68) TaxID=43989 RepID=B1X2K0_CROS5|nr:hypothetical protein [Crocosphaera subtropica]ACB54361.1 hypothetical protein cce_5015 [Crocosphaera subtropica ATCC 51142]